MAPFREAFSGNRFVCWARTIVYTKNTVGRSIASIYDLGSIFTSALCALANMWPQNIYCISAIDFTTYVCITYVCFCVYTSTTSSGCLKNSLQAKGFSVSIIGHLR